MSRDAVEKLYAFERVGALEWIGLRPARRAAMTVAECAQAVAGCGLAGDRSAERAGGKRQVTLIQSEHLIVIARLVGLETIAPEQLRRNLVISGLNVWALKDRRFMIGDVEFEGTGACHPCSRMEESLGKGGFTAMRGHGGITARVLSSGSVCLGARVVGRSSHSR